MDCGCGLDCDAANGGVLTGGCCSLPPLPLIPSDPEAPVVFGFFAGDLLMLPLSEACDEVPSGLVPSGLRRFSAMVVYAGAEHLRQRARAPTPLGVRASQHVRIGVHNRAPLHSFECHRRIKTYSRAPRVAQQRRTLYRIEDPGKTCFRPCDAQRIRAATSAPSHLASCFWSGVRGVRATVLGSHCVRTCAYAARRTAPYYQRYRAHLSRRHHVPRAACRVPCAVCRWRTIAHPRGHGPSHLRRRT